MMLEKFSCINNGGLEIYYKDYFDSPYKIDQQLMAGFFYAIQSISEEIRNPVNFIRLQNSLIYIKSYGDFILILMFSSLPDESFVSKAFEELANLVIKYYTNLTKFEQPLKFKDKVDEILSIFKNKNILDTSINDEIANKIAILGLSKAGKTSIKKKFFDRYTEAKLKSIRPTIGIEITKNIENFLQESIIVSDFGGQKLYINKYLLEEKNWINISSVIYVIDIQDKESFAESLNYLKSIWENITKLNTRIPFLAIFFHKYDESLRSELQDNIQELLTMLRDYMKQSVFFFTSIDDNSIINAFIKTLFLSLPSLIIKQILQSFLIEIFQEKVLDKIKELKLTEKDTEQLHQAGESIGEEVLNNFQKKWVEYYLGKFKVMEQQLNTKKVYLTLNGSILTIEIDNWTKNEIPSSITDPFLTGFLKSIFKSLYISTPMTFESNKISTKWKININPVF